MRHYCDNFPQSSLQDIISRKGIKYANEANLLSELIIQCLDYDQNTRANLVDIENSAFMASNLNKFNLNNHLDRKLILESIDEKYIKPYIFDYNDAYCRNKLSKLSEV